MKKILGYRVYKELTNNDGEVVHKTPVARSGNLKNACTHARSWANGILPMGVYEVYADGTERKVCAY